MSNGFEQNNDSENSLAMELLKEVKTQAKRWAIAFFAVLFLWAGTIGGFLWYLNQYDYSSYFAESQDGGNANIIGRDGEIVNGESKTKVENQEER